MATYEKEKGFTVTTVSTDPIASQISGGAWASAPSLNGGRSQNSGFGTSTAAVTAGGYGASPPAPNYRTLVEEYNGSSWSEVTDIPTATVDMATGGPQTAGFIAGGERPGVNVAETFEYDGTNWTEGGDLNTARRALIGAGTQTAGLAALGAIDPPLTAEAESYNGTSWSNIPEANTARRSAAGGGTSTSALAYGGYTGSYVKIAESYNGTSWSEVGDLSGAIKADMGGGGTSNTDQLAFGGYGGPPGSERYATTEYWNGAAWTELSDLSGARSGSNSLPSAPTNDQLYAGGNTPGGSYVTTTEVWTAPATFGQRVDGDIFYNSTSNTFKITEFNVPGATWASGATYPASIYASAGFGTQDSAVVGSYAPGGGTEAASYNGSAWTVISDVSQDSSEKTGFGESNSSGYLVKGNTENWNGSSWTAVNSATNSFSLRTGFGAPGSAIVAAGESPPSGSNLVESWDGTNWTEISELNTARYAAGGGGSGNTSGIIAGGTTGSNTANSETWNGTSWSEGNELNTARHRVGSAGKSVSQSLIFGGETLTGKTESYNGTSWTELADMATSRIDPAFGSTGTNVAALAVGGREPSTSNKTEEFTASLSNFTITST